MLVKKSKPSQNKRDKKRSWTEIQVQIDKAFDSVQILWIARNRPQVLLDSPKSFSQYIIQSFRISTSLERQDSRFSTKLVRQVIFPGRLLCVKLYFASSSP